MRLIMPTVEVPGDSEGQIMARSGDCVGLDPKRELAVWRFGFLPNSESAQHFHAHISADTDEEWGFLWVLCTTRTAKVKDTWRGIAHELPDNFRRVLDA